MVKELLTEITDSGEKSQLCWSNRGREGLELLYQWSGWTGEKNVSNLRHDGQERSMYGCTVTVYHPSSLPTNNVVSIYFYIFTTYK